MSNQRIWYLSKGKKLLGVVRADNHEMIHEMMGATNIEGYEIHPINHLAPSTTWLAEAPQPKLEKVREEFNREVRARVGFAINRNYGSLTDRGRGFNEGLSQAIYLLTCEHEWNSDGICPKCGQPEILPEDNSHE